MLIPNVTNFYVSSNGQLLEPIGDALFYAQSNYANLILLNLEDGVGTNSVTLVNFTPDTRSAYTSHWFFASYQGIIEHTVTGESSPRSFAQFAIRVPNIVLQNYNKNALVKNFVTIIQRFGSQLIGIYEGTTELDNAFNLAGPGDEIDPATGVLYTSLGKQFDEQGTVAYSLGTQSFYQVDFINSVYAWVAVSKIHQYLESKQYGLGEINVQAGFSTTSNLETISEVTSHYVMQIINNLQIAFADLEQDFLAHESDFNNPHQVQADEVPYDNTTSQLLATDVQGAVDELEEKIDDLQQFDTDIEAGNVTLSKVRIGNETNYAEITYTHTNGNHYQVLDVTYPDGRVSQLNEEHYRNFRNATGIILNSGRLLSATGVTTGQQAVNAVLYDPTGIHNRKVLGVTTIDGVGTNQKSKVTYLGIVTGILLTDLRDTGTAYAEGQFVWGHNDGRLSNVAPDKPSAQTLVGIIINIQGGNADILVCPTVMQFIGDLSDVVITNPATDDILIRNASGVYENSQRFYTLEQYVETIKTHEEEIDDRLDDLEAKDLILEQDILDLQTDKVDKITKIIGLDLQDDILLGEFKTALGNATQSLSGLMSAQDKVDLDTLMALFDSDGDSVVNTIAEVLAIFNSYPEGVDLVTALAGKVDKTMTIAGVDMQNNITKEELKTALDVDDLESTKVDKTTTIAGVDLQNNITKEELQVALDFDDKVDKVIGKSLVEDTEIAKLEDLDTQAQTDAKLDLKFGTIDGEIDDIIDGTQDITFNNTTSGLTATTIKGAIDEIDGNVDELEARTTVLESKIDVVGLDYKEYGVREVVGQSASEFERVTRFWGEIKLGSATGLVANVAIDDANVANSFNYIPIFKREVVNIDATDLSSNVVSNSFVKVPKYYIKEEWTTENGTNYHYIFMSQFKHDGYRLPLPFQREDGTERDYTYMGAYEASLDGNNKLRSLTGQIPRVNYSRNNFRIAARALDGLGINSKYQITDLAEYVDLVQIPFMIEFATKHSQGVFAGATSMAYNASHTAIADGTAVNFIVVSNATGAAFVLGQTVSIGTSNSNDSIAKDRIITQIDVDTPNAGETTITFDGTAVNITIGHVIASRAWKTGMTDSVKVSGTHALNDGKHSIVWRGLENPFGNIWKNVDGVKISNWRGYVAENPKDYNDTASVGGVYAEPYLPLGYLNANTNNYIQELGYDQNYPYAKFPISVQASSGLYFRDYYYQNTGDRTVFVGGDWISSSTAGLFSWYLNIALGSTSFSIGARLSYRP